MLLDWKHHRDLKLFIPKWSSRNIVPIYISNVCETASFYMIFPISFLKSLCHFEKKKIIILIFNLCEILIILYLSTLFRMYILSIYRKGLRWFRKLNSKSLLKMEQEKAKLTYGENAPDSSCLSEGHGQGLTEKGLRGLQWFMDTWRGFELHSYVNVPKLIKHYSSNLYNSLQVIFTSKTKTGKNMNNQNHKNVTTCVGI